MTILSNLDIPISNSKEQENVVNEIESRFSVIDKMEEYIYQSLQQAEVMRQSILNYAFTGRLL